MDQIHIVYADHWRVMKGGHQEVIKSFSLRAHALAFGRALAFSRGVDLIVHEKNGKAIQQHRASLTYPTDLK